MALPDDTLMKDVPMLDTDRENLRSEFEDFDTMTLAEFRERQQERIDGLLDTMNMLTELAKQRKTCEHQWTVDEDGATYCPKCGLEKAGEAK